VSEFILGVDLDGVCGQHTEIFRHLVAHELGIDEESLPLQRSWDFREWNFTDGDFERLHRAAVLEHRMFRDMEVMPGCAEVLWRLSDAGIWIRIVTHRLYVNWGHAIAIADTADWLDRHRIPYRDICFLGDKPDVAAHAYVDDGPHNIIALRSAGHNVITFDQPYNGDIDGPRAANWAELEELVLDLAAKFRGSVPQQFPGIDAGSQRLPLRTKDEL
jgi:5'(3')-deoxyribonucleotidase|tara:strand:+ start:5065 stop:5715 length:651 start_codon:yes stop_codon:yes gene_type:complete